ncbi:hypothetical protein [Streptomyces demainii]|uniref:Uncharacterized protein n=1 Tax=Streptomyces demainii TaxID=588122 RepID=A0ABT9KT11_9ACTN|nr:hypothetical protein [Streptomyces demainii]MDP9611561.1 hypothetical protein [Streptomyces demainii]
MKTSLHKPITHEGTKPADLVGLLVLVRPYYHVPDGRSSLRSVRSPYTFEARVIETFSDEMVKVRFTWASDSAPWRMEAIFYPRELHRTGGWFPMCRCPACAGDGIHEERGA